MGQQIAALRRLLDGEHDEVSLCDALTAEDAMSASTIIARVEPRMHG